MAAMLRFDSGGYSRSEEHTSELQSHVNIVCRLLLEKKNQILHRWPKTRRTMSTTGTSNYPCRPKIRSRRQLLAMTCLEFGNRPRGGVFFFNDTAPTNIYTLSLHDALPI